LVISMGSQKLMTTLGPERLALRNSGMRIVRFEQRQQGWKLLTDHLTYQLPTLPFHGG
jgi:uncharacterized protein YegL